MTDDSAQKMTDEHIETFVMMAERAHAWSQLEDCTIGEAMRRMLRSVRTMTQIDAKVDDNRTTMSLMNGPMPPGKM